MPGTVKITCKGSGTLPLSNLSEFQGELKSLSVEDYKKLRQQIIKLGFTAPIFVWKNGKKNWILDGTQRIRTLRKMQEEGWKIPDLPVAWIRAKDKKDASNRLLAIVSQYGKVEGQGLYEFLHESELELETLEDMRFPEIDLDRWNAEFNEEPESKEFDESAGNDVKMAECPKCGEKFPL